MIERALGVAALATVAAATLAAGTPDRPSNATDGRTVVAGSVVSRPMPATTTTTEPDRRTLRGFNHYRATVRVPMITVYEQPDAGSPAVVELPETAELDTPQTFSVQSELRVPEGDPQGVVWYHVLLPTPPNGSAGWVRAEDVIVEGLDLRIEVNLSEFSLRVLDDDDLVRGFEIGVGTVDTPTPGGDYYVKESYELTRSNSAYGSHALGLNGYSTVLDYWRGGGIIGIHGTDKPESIGTNASHGCIRMRNEDVAEIFQLAPRGTPVTIIA